MKAPARHLQTLLPSLLTSPTLLSWVNSRASHLLTSFSRIFWQHVQTIICCSICFLINKQIHLVWKQQCSLEWIVRDHRVVTPIFTRHHWWHHNIGDPPYPPCCECGQVGPIWCLPQDSHAFWYGHHCWSTQPPWFLQTQGGGFLPLLVTHTVSYYLLFSLCILWCGLDTVALTNNTESKAPWRSSWTCSSLTAGTTSYTLLLNKLSLPFWRARTMT